MNKFFCKNLVLAISLFYLLIPHVSSSQSIQWVEQYGSASSSNVGQFRNAETVNAIETDDQGNVYTIGNYNGLEGYFQQDTLLGSNSTGVSSAVVCKYNSEGLLQWTRTLVSASSNVYGQKLSIDTAGNVYAFCRAYGSFSFNGATYSQTAQGALVFKLSPTNTVLWEQHIQSSYFNLYTAGIQVNSSSELVVAVRFGSNISFDTVNANLNSFGGNYAIIKFNLTDGSVSDYRFIETLMTTYFQSNEAFGGDLFVDEQDNVYLLGVIKDMVYGVDTYDITLNIPSTDPDPTALYKFDANGNYVWHRLMGTTGYQTTDFSITGNDSLVFVGLATGIGTFFYGDSILKPYQFKHSFFGVFDTVGTLTQAHLAEIPTNGKRSVLTDVTLDSNGFVLLSMNNQSGCEFGNLNYYTGTVYDVGTVLRYSIANDSFQVAQQYLSNALQGFSRIRTLHIGNENDLLVGGTFYTDLSIDTFQLTSVGLQDAFVSRTLDCSYLETSIISSSGLLCNGSSVSIHPTESNTNLNYQWKYGTTNISGATDTTYQASIAGDYFLEVSDSVCLFTSDGYTVTNGSSAVVAFNPATTNFCESDSAVVLSGGSPVGGTYFGNGVSGGVFNPSSVAAGLHQLGYVYQHAAGCIDTVYANVQVSEAPLALFVPTVSTVCVGDTVALNSGFPAGGSYAGTAVSGNLFTPTAADTGVQTLYYSRMNSVGCIGIDSITVNVVQTPNVSLNLPTTSICENVPVLPLSGGLPVGGTYAGEGVAGNFFLPNMTSNSEVTINYTVSNGACSATASDTFIIDTLLTAQLPILDSICISAVDMPLGHGLPSGGYYFGNGVSTNLYTVIDSSLAFDTINYTVTNTCGTDTASNLIQFIAAPAISNVITPPNCFGDSTGEVAISVIGGVSPYTYSWTNGTTTAINSNLAAGVYGITASGANGCTASASLVVTEPAAMQLQLDSADAVLCNGFSNAHAFVSTSGGTAPYTFEWSNGELVEDALNLFAGTNNLTVTDANNCTESLSIQISELQPIVVQSSILDVSCFGETDGVINVSVSGGSGGYTYDWSNNDSLPQSTDLASGIYSLITTDSLGCFSLDTFLVQEPDSISVSAQLQDATCFGASDGQIVLSVSGGLGSYSYSWNNGITSAICDSLQAGAYLVTVSDSVGCFKTDSFTVSQPLALTANVIILDSIDCHNGNTGQLQAMATGGSSSIYGFQWSSGQTTSSIDSLAAGMYSISVLDANNCLAFDSVELVNPLPIQVDSFQLTHPLCFGDNNGAINTIASGGTGALIFTWSNGMSNSSISNLNAASYGLTISDQNGCAVSESTTLVDPMEMTLSLTSLNNLCFGDSTGYISTAAINNQGSVAYTWSSGQSNSMINSLPSGHYYVTATDSIGCVAIDSAEITQPTPLSLSVSVQNNLCFGDSSGQLSTAVSGGLTPYSFLWSNGDTASSIDSLAAGFYSLSVSDSNGCLMDTMLQITAPDSLNFVLDSLSNPLCFGDSNGYAEVLATGGSGLINILWNDGSVSFQRNDLTEGIYSFTISDMNACSKSGQLQTIWPLPLTVGFDSINQPLCFGESAGYMAVSAQGGTGALDYSWSNGASGNTIENLDSGLYSVTITDSNNCSLDLSQTIVWPDQIAVNFIVTNAICDLSSDGSLIANGVGGTGSLNYAWSTTDTSMMIDSLSIGVYSLSITDSLGCEVVDSATVSFLATTPSLVPIDDQNICRGDSVEIVLQTNASNALWSNNATNLSETFINEGLYWVEVEDSNCYASDTFSVFINELPVFDLGNDTLICVDSLQVGIELSGPLGMDAYNWNTGEFNPQIVVNQIGIYSLVVIDSNGCEYFDELMIDSGTCVGINEFARSINVLVYPNPNRGSFQLEVEGFDGALSYRFIDSRGKLIQKGTLNQQHHFAFDALSKGLYQMILVTENGEVISKAVVVQ